MDRELAQFTLSDDDGTTFLVEVDKPQSTGRGPGVERVSTPDTNRMVYQASQTLEEALDKVQPVVSKVVSRMKSGLTTPANEVEVTFGLKLGAETGIVFGSVGGEVTFEVKLKWEKESE
ncbi:CU044_2847 family protein [Leptothoe kymatousa]|uniref:Trypsin-co-occurring domain-containing protein n=1 Tax=Leptothoe kymatousa TAU-MAC 1615 TaxID=2364775 RepID=A0ABS5Y7E5_9CYAN|nr:CU044_2847 family protein [Leptothoe kymatousa]MBT9313686.1 hypothetical protein [Leptothoe kymatousa TAU-MAC 1615]